MSLVIAAGAFGASAVAAQTLPTHRIPAALATEAASEAVASCARGGYNETVVVVDADGATIAAVRGDGAGIHTLDSAHDKAYTSVTFKNDTMVLADRAKGDEVIGGIGAAGAPGGNLDDNCAKAGLEKIRDRLK
jgi:uncharacterized protein GlcG (DUF336 family)